MKPIHYKFEEKLKIYSGAPVNKGFYNRNLNKAQKLYTKDNWKPPKPVNIKKFKNETFNQKIDNYIHDFEILKEKYNLPQQSHKSQKIKIIERDYEEIEQKKINVNNILINEINKFFEINFFDITDDIINSMKEEQEKIKKNSKNNINNNINNSELFLLKNTRNIRDYNNRLFSNDNNIELQIEEDKDKNDSIYNINNEAKIDEYNNEQIDEKIEEQMIDNNEEQIIENNEEQIIENNDEKILENNEEEDINESEMEEKSKDKNEEKLKNKNLMNNNILKGENKNLNNNENSDYPLFHSIIGSDYNKPYSPYNYYNDDFKQKLDEIEKINDNYKNIENENNNNIDNIYNEKDYYDNEFVNQEVKSNHESNNYDDDYI